MADRYTFDLSGKAAVVTGASSGIGAGIARHLADAGARVLGVGRDPERLAQTCAHAPELAKPLAIDITDDQAPDAIVSAALAELGRIDVFVHAAGLSLYGPFAEMTDERLDLQWAVNVRAPFRLTRAALPHLGPGSSVIFISSIMGQAGGADCAAYCATKGALEQLSAALAVELAQAGIRFNCIAPGAVETPMNDDRREDADFYEAIKEFAPAKRWGTVDDIAPAAVFLASDAADFFHGARLAIDGGWVAR